MTANMNKTGLVACALSAVSLIAFVIYGNVFDYFDFVVFLFLLAAVVLYGCYVKFAGKLANAACLAAVMCVSGAEALFLENSFPVWADEVNHITMYNSRGGLVPVVLILILLLASAITGIVACFAGKEMK